MIYETKNFNKSDWKLFREKVPLWQENYMNKVNLKIEKIVTDSSKNSSDKFWAIEKLIYDEKKNPGVLIEMKRSSMFTNTLMLIKTKAITFDDLADFSKDFQDYVKRFLEN